MSQEQLWKEMWEKLGLEMDYLAKEGVVSLHPQVVKGYMSYIEQLGKAYVEGKLNEW